MEGLEGVDRRYAWGDPRFIPDLLGLPADGTPFAELWFGAHPSAPSTLQDSGVTLDRAVRADPGAVLGQGTVFPFLAKVLAAAEPLSIQVHPDADQAREGHEREDAKGIALDAADRTYRDPFPKPELICALTPFSAKCGLRRVTDTLELLALLDVEALDPLRAILAGPPGTGTAEGEDAGRLREAIRWLFTDVDADAATDMVDALSTAAATAADAGRFQAVLSWTVRLARTYPGDVGVIVSLLLNHVELAPGQALYMGAGHLHSYLSGAAVEIMAPSDNVVRGGLTRKHVDTAELLRVLDASPMQPVVQDPSGPLHRYVVPDEAFGLTRVEPGPTPLTLGEGPGVLLMVEGEATVAAGGDTRGVARGSALFVPAEDGPVTLTGTGLAFWADGGR